MAVANDWGDTGGTHRRPQPVPKGPTSHACPAGVCGLWILLQHSLRPTGRTARAFTDVPRSLFRTKRLSRVPESGEARVCVANLPWWALSFAACYRQASVILQTISLPLHGVPSRLDNRVPGGPLSPSMAAAARIKTGGRSACAQHRTASSRCPRPAQLLWGLAAGKLTL